MRERSTFSCSLIIRQPRIRTLIFPPSSALLTVVDLDSHPVVRSRSASLSPRNTREVGLDESASVLDGAELGEPESLRDARRPVHNHGRRVDRSSHILEELSKRRVVHALGETKEDDGRRGSFRLDRLTTDRGNFVLKSGGLGVRVGVCRLAVLLLLELRVLRRVAGGGRVTLMMGRRRKRGMGVVSATVVVLLDSRGQHSRIE